MLGLTLARTGAAPKALGVVLAIGAVLFPASRIPDVEALAIASDVLLGVALVPLGLGLLGWRALGGSTAAGTPVGAAA